MIQQGTQALADTEAHATIVFGRSFPATPAIIHAWVENLVDDPLLAINLEVVDKNKDGFAVALSPAPDSGNYTLQWFAGDMQDMYQVLLSGRTTAEHPLFSGALADNDFVLITTVSPTLRTVRVRVSTFLSMFPSWVPAPSAPTSPGRAGQIAFGPGRVYTHDGTLWGVSTRTTNWS